MARSYVRESLTYWLKEYHVDGSGSTYSRVAHSGSSKTGRQLSTSDPTVILYGETLGLGGPTWYSLSQ